MRNMGSLGRKQHSCCGVDENAIEFHRVSLLSKGAKRRFCGKGILKFEKANFTI